MSADRRRTDRMGWLDWARGRVPDCGEVCVRESLYDLEVGMRFAMVRAVTSDYRKEHSPFTEASLKVLAL